MDLFTFGPQIVRGLYIPISRCWNHVKASFLIIFWRLNPNNQYDALAIYPHLKMVKPCKTWVPEFCWFIFLFLQWLKPVRCLNHHSSGFNPSFCCLNAHFCWLNPPFLKGAAFEHRKLYGQGAALSRGGSGLSKGSSGRGWVQDDLQWKILLKWVIFWGSFMFFFGTPLIAVKLGYEYSDYDYRCWIAAAISIRHWDYE